MIFIKTVIVNECLWREYADTLRAKKWKDGGGILGMTTSYQQWSQMICDGNFKSDY